MSNRHVGLLAALLRAADRGALVGLTRFTPEVIAPKLADFLPAPASGRQLDQSLWYAKRKGLIATREQPDGLSIILTYKGRERLLTMTRLGLTVKQPGSWDGKWRLVSFDVPERRRYARDTLRLSLKRMGFVSVEKSLWAYPYDCRQELLVVADALLLTPYIKQYLVESFDGEDKLLAHFGLKKSADHTESPSDTSKGLS
jgi:hypothetical protein